MKEDEMEEEETNEFAKKKIFVKKFLFEFLILMENIEAKMNEFFHSLIYNKKKNEMMMMNE